MKHITVDQTLGFLETLASRSDVELEWIDLLSQLEYVGCRKIVRSVGFERIDLDLLRHVQEEALHAYLLKAVAEQSGLAPRPWTQGKLSQAGWRYFQELDQLVSAETPSEGLRYPGVSWAVERRVLEMYPAYLRLTRNPALKRALTQILAQERRHGGQFERVEFPEGFREKVIAIEERLWRRFQEEALAALAAPGQH